nr:MBL fold metallo-hydrolase [Sphingomonas alba]
MLTAASVPVDYHLVSGQVTPGKGPDGNSIFLDTKDGLILIDTGRHPEHRDRLLAYAKERGRAIIAIFNTHWHLDHTTGNAEIRAAYPRARVYATDAIDGAITDFFPKSRKGAEEYLKSGKVPPAMQAELQRGFYVMDHPDTLRPTDVVKESRSLTIGGRRLDVHVAHFAATEADLWLYDPKARLAIVGDLVVGLVPFMDTACPDGWRKAIDEVAATRFETLIPGHGEPMDRARFLQWKSAYGNFVDCGHSTKPVAECFAGWLKDAAPFIDDAHRDYASQAAEYYVTTRLRSSPEEQQHYCKPLNR